MKTIYLLTLAKNGQITNKVYYKENIAQVVKKNYEDVGYKTTLEQYTFEKEIRI